MISPYKGKFRVSQEYKGVSHQGIDLVGIDSKNIYSIFEGKVEVASNADPDGFGIYVRMRITTGPLKGYVCYYGHLSKVKVKVGQTIKVGELLGVEGSTGHSTGSHLHLEVRKTTTYATYQNICTITGIPNKIGVYSTAVANATKYVVKSKVWIRTEPKMGGATRIGILPKGRKVTIVKGSAKKSGNYTFVTVKVGKYSFYANKNKLKAA